MSLSNEILTEINNSINKEHVVVERKKFTTLTVGTNYIVKKLTFLTTRFGKAIIVMLYDSGNDATFETFLPKRVVENLSGDIIEIMNKSEGKYTLTYLGQSPNLTLGGNSKALLNFGCLE